MAEVECERCEEWKEKYRKLEDEVADLDAELDEALMYAKDAEALLDRVRDLLQ